MRPRSTSQARRDRDDPYVEITTILRAVRDQAIEVDRGVNDRRRVWIPRSVVFGPQDAALPAIGAEFKLRLRKWKADDLELQPDRDRRQGSLGL